jgi:hypothetical protein
MATSDLDYKYILNQFLKTIQIIADRSYQERVWVLGVGPEVNDFDETAMFFMEDCEMILPKYTKYSITEKQYLALVQFDKLFRSFSDNYTSWAPDFIDMPEWAHVIKEAKKVLKEFNFPQPA